MIIFSALTIVLTVVVHAAAQPKSVINQQASLASAGNSKNDKSVNEQVQVGAGIQINDGHPSNVDQQHSNSGGFPNLLFTAVQSNGGQQNSPPNNLPFFNPAFGNPTNPAQQSFNPSQWPGAPEPFQIVQPSVGSQQDPDYKSFDMSKSPYQELLKSLAATAPIFPPEPPPSVAQNPSGSQSQIYFGNNVMTSESVGSAPVDLEKLDPPGPPRPPLNIDNANYLTAVASIPTRLGPILSQSNRNNNLFPGATVYQGQLLASTNSQPQQLANSIPFQGPPPQLQPAPFPSSPNLKSPNLNNNIPPPPPLPLNSNQFVYTHSGNQFPLTKNLNAKSSSVNPSFSQLPTQYSTNFIRAQPQTNQGTNTANSAHNRQHPSNQSFGVVYEPQVAGAQPKLSPFTVQVGDILGFPPGTPFSAVPAGLPSGSRVTKEGAAFQVLAGKTPVVPVDVSAYRRVYSELPISNTRTTPPVTKPSSYEKSEEIMKENKRTFSVTSNASVVSYSRSMCQVCDEIDKILRLYNITVYTFELDTMEKGHEMYDLLQQQTGTKEMPQIFVCGRFVGGYNKISELHRTGMLKQMLERC